MGRISYHAYSTQIWRQVNSRVDDVLLFRQQQKLLKVLEKLDPAPSHRLVQIVNTDSGKQQVSYCSHQAVKINGVLGCDGDKCDECFVFCRDGSPQWRSPLRCILPWRFCQIGEMLCRLGWLSCSSSVSETRSYMCRLTTLTFGTLPILEIWGRSSTAGWR